MPHVAYKCPWPAKWRLDENNRINKNVPIEECLNCSLTRPDRGCQWDFADLMARREDVGYDGGLFTPSRFLGCDRELYLRERYDFATDPALQAYKVRGSATHKLLETDDPRAVCETRVFRGLPGAVDHKGVPAVVSVRPDMVYPTLKQIHDTKTYKYLPRGGPGFKPGEVHPIEVKEAYRLQLSVGAWAWASPFASQEPGETLRPLFPSDAIEITHGQLIIRDSTTQIRIAPIELLPFPALEEWMRERVAELNEVRLGKEPGYCSEDLRWKCATCPVLELCGIPKELYVKNPTSRTGKERTNGTKVPTRSTGRRRVDTGRSGGAGTAPKFTVAC